MKIDIEALVKTTFEKQDAESLLEFQLGSLEAFTKLVVERCAQECESLFDDYDWAMYRAGCKESASAIRALVGE